MTKELAVIGKTEGFRKEGYGWLSNMFVCNGITLDGINYPSVEAAYQAAKTTDAALRKPFEQMSSWNAKKAGKALPLRSDWDEVRIPVMLDLLRQKFSRRNPELLKLLLATGGAEIVEGNFWNDTFWGWSIQTQTGENWLGRLLEQVRQERRIEDLKAQERLEEEQFVVETDLLGEMEARHESREELAPWEAA